MHRASDLSKAKVLLVDHEAGNLEKLLGMLEPGGYQLLTASSSREALRVAARALPDLVLIDVAMPEMDGFEVCAHLLTDPHTAHASVIFLAPLDDLDSKVRGLQLGAVDVINTPLLEEEVSARVDTHLTVARLHATLAEQNEQLTSAKQHILEAVAEGIYGLDVEGNITFANPAASALTGYSEEELVGNSVHELHLYARWDGTPYHFIETRIYHTLRSGEVSAQETDVFWRKSGDHFPVAWNCAPILRGGQVQGAVLAFHDISARKRQELALRDALEEVEQLRDRLQAENRYLQQELASGRGFDNIVGESAALRAVLEQIEQVAPTNSSVLIMGESGTGKEALARAIHEHSARRDRPLIKVNCGAITPSLIESELFGHEKGAFTGAVKQRQGYFEVADGGTIFLDEIGELPLEAQVKLLRVLQEQEFNRVGSEEPIRVDVRVITATNRDLGRMVEKNKFRMDLFYRLNVFPLYVPPLRERREDIPLLVRKFLHDEGRRLGREFNRVSEESLRLLQNYHWPGNIRELQNVIERSAILAQDPVVSIAPDLVRSNPSANIEHDARAVAQDGGFSTLAENESAYIRHVLEHTHWLIAGKGGAAEILGMPASTLRSRMKKLGIARPR